ncbi:MAG: PilT/PilU family type 4a pilus ATPase [Sedimentisphaerales bacterium]|nr:PilT/PilU family type 4a pilus ATPase [Sedimentisphaerales bacterium]
MVTLFVLQQEFRQKEYDPLGKQPLTKRLALDKPAEIDRYFKAAIKIQASDLHLKGGLLPRMRVSGGLRQTTGEPVSEEKLEQLIFEILSPEQKAFFLENGALDFAYDMGGTDRFRVNVYRTRGNVALAARRVSSKVPAFESLNLPASVQKIAEIHQGLVLVTGVTGCGKSTTIASMLDHINRNRSCHIITIEDPIEFIFQDDKALISQREIGVDVVDYEDALRSLMREDPDVVLIGEMRDYETLTAGLRAAETGHLVFGTLHSTDAYQTVTRILDLTPQIERHMIRQAIVGNLKGIISQRLLPTVVDEPKRVPAVEIMIANAPTRKLIADGREVELPTVIKSSYGEGMVDYTESLRRLVEKDYIDLKTAYNYAPNAEELKMALKGIRSTSGGIIG